MRINYRQHFINAGGGRTTLLIVVASLAAAAGADALAGLMMLIPPLHKFRQIKGAYGLTRSGALWRPILLAVFAITAIGPFISILLALGMF